MIRRSSLRFLAQVQQDFRLRGFRVDCRSTLLIYRAKLRRSRFRCNANHVPHSSHELPDGG